ncbi:hypothetical protein JRI60_13375 [Archangium violaceum]|uniref:hypothetical protein n=1 Tax=Archangium violaceum TaxID=83451 RepID=UPI00194E0B58|nr:hypothetical protein [Archangium violaceum]QRN99944.1 hypothetical protein JRI60_13375 [Archangium violaceum]
MKEAIASPLPIPRNGESSMRLVCLLLVGGFCLLGCKTSDEKPAPPRSVLELEEKDFTGYASFEVGQDQSSVDTGLTIHQGQALLIQATGTLQTDIGEVGPEGSTVRRSQTTSCMFPGPAYRLLARIGQRVFPVGEELALVAPEDGPLELLINYCESSITGRFSVRVHDTLLEPEVLADSPPLTDNSVLETHTVRVEADTSEWLPTEIQLTKGRKVFITARGTVESGGVNFDANGSKNVKPLSVLPHRRAFRLHGRIAGKVLDLGRETVFLSPANDRLELLINRTDDTHGGFDVEVGLGVVPARGLGSLRPEDFTQHQPISKTPDFRAPAETSFEIEKGTPLLISATGKLFWYSRTFPNSDLTCSYGPAGCCGSTENGPFPFPTERPNALYGRIGEQIFHVGEESILLAPASGKLELFINGVSLYTFADCDIATFTFNCNKYCFTDGSPVICRTRCLPVFGGSFDATVHAP